MRLPEPTKTIDKRSNIEKAKDELADNFRRHVDPQTVGSIVHFTDSVRAGLLGAIGTNDYTREAVAVGRIATLIADAADRAKIPIPPPEPIPEVDPDADLEIYRVRDEEREQLRHKRKSAKWNRRRKR